MTFRKLCSGGYTKPAQCCNDLPLEQCQVNVPQCSGEARAVKNASEGIVANNMLRELCSENQKIVLCVDACRFAGVLRSGVGTHQHTSAQDISLRSVTMSRMFRNLPCREFV